MELPLGNHGQSTCAGIYRNSHRESKDCFAINLGISNALFSELKGVILALEIAYHKN